jgi:hypothetical protein
VSAASLRNRHRALSSLHPDWCGGAVTTLAVAIRRKQWELVALRLLCAVAEEAAALDAGSLEELFALLGDEPGDGRREKGGGRDGGRSLRGC